MFPIGTQAIEYTVTAIQPWILLEEQQGPGRDRRYWVSIDWAKAPDGASTGEVVVKGSRTVSVKVPAMKATPEQRAAAQGHYSSLTGPIAIAASAATKQTEVAGVRWVTLPDYGRGEAAMTVHPVTAASLLPPAAAPTLEYPVYLPRAGRYTVTLVLGPVMDLVPERGIRLAAAFDDGAPQVLDIFADRAAETFLSENWWQKFTRDNVRYLRSTHEIAAAGPHVFKLAMVDPAVVVQSIIISDQRLPESYFGPPDTPLVP